MLPTGVEGDEPQTKVYWLGTIAQVEPSRRSGLPRVSTAHTVPSAPTETRLNLPGICICSHAEPFQRKRSFAASTPHTSWAVLTESCRSFLPWTGCHWEPVQRRTLSSGS